MDDVIHGPSTARASQRPHAWLQVMSQLAVRHVNKRVLDELSMLTVGRRLSWGWPASGVQVWGVNPQTPEPPSRPMRIPQELRCINR